MNLNKDFVTPEHVDKREEKFRLGGPPWKIDEIKLINVQTRVDWKLMEYYGYKPINAAEAYDSRYIRRI